MKELGQEIIDCERDIEEGKKLVARETRWLEADIRKLADLKNQLEAEKEKLLEMREDSVKTQ